MATQPESSFDWSSVGQGAIGSVLDFGLNQLSGSINAKRSWKYQKKAMAEQYKYNEMAAESTFNRNLKMWNLENEYNTPQAQMQRYLAAGLNPHLIYGQNNTGASFNSAPTSPVSGAHIDTKGDSNLSIVSAISAFQDMALKGKQIELLGKEGALKDAQVNEVNQRIAESVGRTDNLKVRTDVSSFQYALMKELRDYTIKTAINNSLLSGARAGYWSEMNKIKSKEARDYIERGIRPTDNVVLRFINMIADYFGAGFGLLTKPSSSFFN